MEILQVSFEIILKVQVQKYIIKLILISDFQNLNFDRHFHFPFVLGGVDFHSKCCKALLYHPVKFLELPLFSVLILPVARDYQEFFHVEAIFWDN